MRKALYASTVRLMFPDCYGRVPYPLTVNACERTYPAPFPLPREQPVKHEAVTKSPLAIALESQRADAIFLSELSAHETHTASELLAAIHETTARCGGQRACDVACAYEYGEHPETAIPRMRWAHELAARLPISTPYPRA